MRARARILAGEGLICGALAGLALGAGEMVEAALARAPAVAVLQRNASVVLGRAAFASSSHHIIFLGAVVHVALSALFGLLYAVTLARVPIESTRSYAREVVFGALFGAALWAVNYHVVARVAFPWMLEGPTAARALMHVLLYGVPLGLMLAATERQVEAAERLADHAA